MSQENRGSIILQSGAFVNWTAEPERLRLEWSGVFIAETVALKRSQLVLLANAFHEHVSCKVKHGDDWLCVDAHEDFSATFGTEQMKERDRVQLAANEAHKFAWLFHISQARMVR